MDTLLQVFVDMVIQVANATTECCSLSSHYQPDLRKIKLEKNEELEK